MLRRLVRPLRRRWNETWWPLASRIGYQPDRLANGLTVGAVLLSYRRQHNIDPILASLLRGRLIDKVILSNDDPSTSIGDFVSHTDERLTIIDQAENRGPGVRWRLAHEMLADVDIVVCVDDDLFLYPRQIERLCGFVAASPGTPHGVAGIRDREIVQRKESPVDVLWRAYAVTREHVERYVEIVSGMHEHRDDVERLADDVVISLVGDAPAQVHDVGYLLSCRSQTDPDIAVHQRPHFHETRRAVRAAAQQVRSQTSWG